MREREEEEDQAFNTPPHFSESRIQEQYSSFGFPRNASEYFSGSLITVAAITFNDQRSKIKDCSENKIAKAINYVPIQV